MSVFKNEKVSVFATITKKERKIYKIKIKMMGPVNDSEPVIVFKQ